MSRLLVKLKADNDARCEAEHHKQLQRLVYHLLYGSEYAGIHDKQGYKFFSYSSIFPFADLKKGDSRNLLISSPNSRFISFLKEQLDYLHEITIGAMKLKIESCRKFDIVLNRLCSFSLITGTPIISRIHHYRYEQANALQLVNGYDSIYWEVSHSLTLFLHQLEDNLYKNYNEYFGYRKTNTHKRLCFLRASSLNKSLPRCT
jgi:CRISPR-associated endoribonuclease Cas6